MEDFKESSRPRNDWNCIFINTHNDKACSALKQYNDQCEYADGSLKPAKYRKSLSYYAELHGFTCGELKQHWGCITHDNQ